jgi:hypothetical protein
MMMIDTRKALHYLNLFIGTRYLINKACFSHCSLKRPDLTNYKSRNANDLLGAI